MSYIIPAGARRVDWITEMEKKAKGDSHLVKTAQCIEDETIPSESDLEIADVVIEEGMGEAEDAMEISQQDRLIDAIKDLPDLKEQVDEILEDVKEKVEEIAETVEEAQDDKEEVKEEPKEEEKEVDEVEIEIKDDDEAVEISQENDEVEIEIDDEDIVKETCGVIASKGKVRVEKKAQNQTVKQVASDPSSSPDVLAKILLSGNDIEAMKLAVQNPNMPINALYEVARNPSTSSDVLMAMAQRGGRVAELARKNPGYPMQQEGANATEVGPEDIVKTTYDKVAKTESSGFVKIAKLSPENRKSLKEYWMALGFPKEYVDAMTKDYE